MIGAEADYHPKVLLLELAFQNLTYIAKTNSKNKHNLPVTFSNPQQSER